MLPEDGFNKPSSMEIVVVFPAPWPPSKPVSVPFSREKERSLTAVKDPKDLDNFSTTTTDESSVMGNFKQGGLYDTGHLIIVFVSK